MGTMDLIVCVYSCGMWFVQYTENTLLEVNNNVLVSKNIMLFAKQPHLPLEIIVCKHKLASAQCTQLLGHGCMPSKTGN